MDIKQLLSITPNNLEKKVSNKMCVTGHVLAFVAKENIAKSTRYAFYMKRNLRGMTQHIWLQYSVFEMKEKFWIITWFFFIIWNIVSIQEQEEQLSLKSNIDMGKKEWGVGMDPPPPPLLVRNAGEHSCWSLCFAELWDQTVHATAKEFDERRTGIEMVVAFEPLDSRALWK